MALSPDPARGDLSDYVARFVHPTRRMRTATIRAETMANAAVAVDEKLAGDGWTGWTLLDLVTRTESVARSQGLNR